VKNKRVTSQDVANLAGVSRTTVSLVLNDVEGISISPRDTPKVRDAAEQLGYIPNATAQALATQRAQAHWIGDDEKPPSISLRIHFYPKSLGAY
jgi:DNA-binding LacI/PurR family transcriptional regulator